MQGHGFKPGAANKIKKLIGKIAIKSSQFLPSLVTLDCCWKKKKKEAISCPQGQTKMYSYTRIGTGFFLSFPHVGLLSQWNRNQWILGNLLTIHRWISKRLDLSPNLFSFPVERRFFFHSNKLESLKQKSRVSYMMISSKNVEKKIAGKCEALINTQAICLKARTMFLAEKYEIAFLSHLESLTTPHPTPIPTLVF